MINIYIKACLKIIALLWGLIISIQSYATCDPQGKYTAPVSLQGGTFSAGGEMAVGSIIRIQRINGYKDSYTPCVGETYMTYTATGGALYSGQTYIYQTGVSGLGVRFKNTQSGIYHGTANRGSGWNGTIPASRFSVDVEFVKMGAISAGQVNTSLFPTLTAVTSDSSGGVPAATYSFSGGSFTVQTPTCITPNYTYNLGTYMVDYFSSTNPTSPWVDTPAILTNCPTFYGNNSNGSYSNYTITNLNGGGQATNSGTLAPNVLQMRLTPNTTIIDAANGIVSTDSSSSAQGIAVQLGNKQSGTYVVQNLNNAMSVTTTSGGATTVTFPLAARMTKTNLPVKAGNISTSLVYTISYQ